jgi:hypothetical protein
MYWSRLTPEPNFTRLRASGFWCGLVGRYVMAEILSHRILTSVVGTLKYDVHF